MSRWLKIFILVIACFFVLNALFDLTVADPIDPFASYTEFITLPWSLFDYDGMLYSVLQKSLKYPPHSSLGGLLLFTVRYTLPAVGDILLAIFVSYIWRRFRSRSQAA